MKALDLRLQEFHVAKAICHLLKGFDFITGSLQWSGGKAVEIIVGKDAWAESSQGIGKTLKHSDARDHGSFRSSRSTEIQRFPCPPIVRYAVGHLSCSRQWPPVE